MLPFDAVAAQCDNFTNGKTATSRYLSVSRVGVNLAALLLDGFPRLPVPAFSFPCSDQESQARQEQHGCSCMFLLVHLFTIGAADCEQGDEMKTFATVEKSPPPLRLLKRPLEIMRFDGVISWLLRKLCFSDVIYLVLCRHPVMMTCHSSLFCALYLYMIRLLFHCISLDLSPIFCAIPATNEKIKKRNILCAVSNTFSIVEYDTRT